VNYYPFHIGDYLSATRHLSWEEDAAFRRLLDTYYTTEKPLPPDHRAVCRLVLATTDAQREAVRVVLEEFFEATPEGWVNHRAAAEIETMREKQEKQREKANKRWSKPRAEPGNAPAMPRDSETHAAASKCDADAMPPTPTPTPTPTKEPKQKRPARSVPALTFAAPDWIDAEAWTAYLAMRAKKRAHPTDYACRLVVAELEKLRRQGHDPAESLRQSTRNSWTDVYPPRNGNADAGRQRNHESAADRVARVNAEAEQRNGLFRDDGPDDRVVSVQ
jgi:uncharacterized protein YdaU (DUF1376 family)